MKKTLLLKHAVLKPEYSGQTRPIYGSLHRQVISNNGTCNDSMNKNLSYTKKVFSVEKY